MGLLSKYKRYYFFYGSNEYSKMKRIRSLVDSVIEKGFKDFDYNVFEGRGLDASLLINTACSPPFGSPLRVVLLRDLDKVSPKSLGLIEKFISSIPDYTTLVMTSSKGVKSADGKKKIDKRKKIYKTLFADKNSCKEFAEPTPASAVKHVLETAKETEIKISHEAAAYLVETAGCDIGRLERELNKLSLYAGTDEPVKQDDIALVSGAGAIGTVFDLPEKIADGDTAGALRLLHSLLITRQPGGTILFRIKDYFLNLNMVKLQNISSNILIGRFRLLQKTAESLAKASRKLPPECITNCLYLIYEGETELKSAGLKNDIVLIKLVSSLGIEIAGNKIQS